MKAKSIKVTVGLTMAMALAVSAVNVDVAVSKPGHEVPALTDYHIGQTFGV